MRKGGRNKPISNQQSAISNQQSAISNHQSAITNHQSPITNHQSKGMLDHGNLLQECSIAV
jgi:hypothetical protein